MAGIICVMFRYAVVFRSNHSETKDSESKLSNYGKILEVTNSQVGNDPVTIYTIECSLKESRRLKDDLHCVAFEENRYVLFPLENDEEKRLALEDKEYRMVG